MASILTRFMPLQFAWHYIINLDLILSSIYVFTQYSAEKTEKEK